MFIRESKHIIVFMIIAVPSQARTTTKKQYSAVHVKICKRLTNFPVTLTGWRNFLLWATPQLAIGGENIGRSWSDMSYRGYQHKEERRYREYGEVIWFWVLTFIVSCDEKNQWTHTCDCGDRNVGSAGKPGILSITPFLGVPIYLRDIPGSPTWLTENHCFDFPIT